MTITWKQAHMTGCCKLLLGSFSPLVFLFDKYLSSKYILILGIISYELFCHHKTLHVDIMEKYLASLDEDGTIIFKFKLSRLVPQCHIP